MKTETVQKPMELLGVSLIAAERQRQVTQEGWTAEHDDLHDTGEMAFAAATYAIEGLCDDPSIVLWPQHWRIQSFKPSLDRIRNLEKAGALIAAEIDRLLRLKSESAPSVPSNNDSSTTPRVSSSNLSAAQASVEKWEVEARAQHYNILRNGTAVYEGCTSEWYANKLVEHIHASLLRVAEQIQGKPGAAPTATVPVPIDRIVPCDICGDPATVRSETFLYCDLHAPKGAERL